MGNELSGQGGRRVGDHRHRSPSSVQLGEDLHRAAFHLHVAEVGAKVNLVVGRDLLPGPAREEAGHVCLHPLPEVGLEGGAVHGRAAEGLRRRVDHAVPRAFASQEHPVQIEEQAPDHGLEDGAPFRRIKKMLRLAP